MSCFTRILALRFRFQEHAAWHISHGVSSPLPPFWTIAVPALCEPWMEPRAAGVGF